jgi:hypothetical protein
MTGRSDAEELHSGYSLGHFSYYRALVLGFFNSHLETDTVK